MRKKLTPLAVVAAVLSCSPAHAAVSGTTWSLASWGGFGDGVHDDRAVLETAIAYISAHGGGVLNIPAGTYLLASKSTDADSFNSMITAKDNVAIVGAGQGLTTIKLADNAIALFPALAGPNIFAKTTQLKNFRVTDLTFEMNGTHNLRTGSGDTARNMAAVASYNGGFGCVFDRVTVQNDAGNQCIWLQAQSEAGQGWNVIRNCAFLTVGSAVAGNYSPDHSSVYLNGQHNRVVNNRFDSAGAVNGSCFELHGSDNEAYGNYGNNYTRGWYFAANYAPSTGLRVHDNRFDNVSECFGWGSTPGQTFGQVEVRNNTWTFDGTTAGTSAQAAVNAPSQVCDSFVFDHNTLEGWNGLNKFAVQHNLYKRCFITNNTLRNFGSGAVRTGGTSLGDGTMGHEMVIANNDFIDCLSSANEGTYGDYLHLTGTSTLKNLTITGNVYRHTATEAVAPFYINPPIVNGLFTGNLVPATMTAAPTVSVSAAAGLVIRNDFFIDPDSTNTQAAPGSDWYNNATGVRSHKNVVNTAFWQRFAEGSAPPSSGTWRAQDVEDNNALVAGAPTKWICTSGGTSGTWVPMAFAYKSPVSVTTSTATIGVNDRATNVSYAGAVTLTLPSASAMANYSGATFDVADVSGSASTTNYIGFSAGSGTTLDGTPKIASPLGKLTLYLDGTVWRVK